MAISAQDYQQWYDSQWVAVDDSVEKVIVSVGLVIDSLFESRGILSC